MSNPNITISGRIGTDIEARKMPDGTQKAKFRIITSDRKKNDRGDWEDSNVSGWTIVAWDKLAEKSIRSLSKGDLITVQGQIKEVSWLDPDGNKKKSTETRASEISVNIYGLKIEEDSIPERDDEIQW
jgi:single-strand DNA-binding protein